MMTALARMRKGAQNHRQTHPGHEVDERHGTDVRGPWASWICLTCVDIAKEKL